MFPERSPDFWLTATSEHGISFVTLDHRQETVAASLGFQT